jgi:glycosyltransferase involved in cell wall biosynthesis
VRILAINWQDRLNPAAGGAEVHLHRVFGGLAARGHEVTLLTSGWPGSPPCQPLDGMEVHRTGSRHSFSLMAPLYYRRALRGHDFDVVVEDLNKVPLWTPAWVAPPLVLLVHHLFGGTSLRSAAPPVALATWLAERPLARAYARVPVQAVSRSTAEDLVARGFRRDRIRVIPNGVDARFFRPTDPPARTPEPTLAFVGRLQRYKRVDLIVRAVAFAKRLGVELRLRIAGTGPAEPGLRRLAGRLGVGGQVEFLGYVSADEKLRLLQSAWIHVLTSEKEGWGLSVMEAAACGTPTVGSSSPGLRDSVVSRRTGLLLPHGDWVDLGSQLVDLVRDPARLAEMGRAARARAEVYSWDRAVEATEAHLAETARGAAVPRPVRRFPPSTALQLPNSPPGAGRSA